MYRCLSVITTLLDCVTHNKSAWPNANHTVYHTSTASIVVNIAFGRPSSFSLLCCSGDSEENPQPERAASRQQCPGASQEGVLAADEHHRRQPHDAVAGGAERGVPQAFREHVQGGLHESPEGPGLGEDLRVHPDVEGPRVERGADVAGHHCQVPC